MGERVVNGSFLYGASNWTLWNPSGGRCSGVSWRAYNTILFSNAYCTPVSISQDIDLTNVPHLDWVMARTSYCRSGHCGHFQILIDDVVVYTLGGAAEEGFVARSLPIDYTGIHKVSFLVGDSWDVISVALQIISAIGSDLPPAPVAAFTGYPTGGVAPLDVLFTDESTNSPTEWLWSFGDGYLSTDKNPWHTYADPGSYTVNLKATNAGGFGTLQKNDYIVVTIPPPTATLLWKFQFGPS